MAMYFSQKLVIVLVLVGPCVSVHDREPFCTSRFDFEEKLLHKMVKIEHDMNLLKENMNKQFAELEGEKNGVARDVTELRESMKKDRDDVLEQVSDLRSRVQEYFDNVSKTITTRSGEEEAEATKGAPVVFSVKDCKSVLKNKVVVFTDVLSNEGNAYDLTTGKFTCPVNGVYSFSFTIRSDSKGYVHCDIRKNGGRLNYAISEGTNDLGSITVHPKLNAGDIIDIGNCVNWKNVVTHPTSFSGYLIYRIDN